MAGTVFQPIMKLSPFIKHGLGNCLDLKGGLNEKVRVSVGAIKKCVTEQNWRRNWKVTG